jgi:hypothetical protein
MNWKQIYHTLRPEEKIEALNLMSIINEARASKKIFHQPLIIQERFEEESARWVSYSFIRKIYKVMRLIMIGVINSVIAHSVVTVAYNASFFIGFIMLSIFTAYAIHGFLRPILRRPLLRYNMLITFN